ncbi:enterochelin esterase [Neptunomonas phycophila]|uniref:enterochelin esterase n=1 Tax=Neptunomonas phycophila TaxID=1572645 RepID=UPI0030F5370D
MSIKHASLTGALLTCLFTSTSWSSDSQGPLHIEKSINNTAPATISIVLHKDEYITGKFKTTHEKSSLSLWKDGKTVKLLSTNGRERFSFVSHEQGKYTFTVTASDDDKFTLTIAKPESAYQTTQIQIASQAEPSSPLVKTALQTYQNTQSTQSFWRTLSRQGTPLIEPIDDNQSLVTFLWKGAQRNVRILGAPSSDHDPLYRLGNSDIWFRSYVLPNDTRLSYQMAPDVPELPKQHPEHRVSILSTAQKDPLNPHIMEIYDSNKPSDQFSQLSALSLPQAKQSPWLTEQSATKGQLTHTTFYSELLDNTRKITIYQPAGFDQLTRNNVQTTFPLAIFFDGQAYQHKIPTPRILDNLINAKQIPPTLAVFIDNPSRETRSSELPCNPIFAKALAKELLPWITQQTKYSFAPETTLLSGSSYGGLASACTAFAYPDNFGLVLSQSGSFWWAPVDEPPEWLTRQIEHLPTKPIRFYINAGVFETGRGTIDILESNRHLHNLLQTKGYTATYEEYSGGHDYYQWRNNLAKGLISLLGKKPSD